MKIVPDQIQRRVPGHFISLGTDGFGRSDGRAALRNHFEVDRRYITVTALQALADDGALILAALEPGRQPHDLPGLRRPRDDGHDVEQRLRRFND